MLLPSQSCDLHAGSLKHMNYFAGFAVRRMTFHCPYIARSTMVGTIAEITRCMLPLLPPARIYIEYPGHESRRKLLTLRAGPYLSCDCCEVNVN
eukprot:6201004-Pleurochrysis_carterae.AAC.1